MAEKTFAADASGIRLTAAAPALATLFVPSLIGFYFASRAILVVIAVRVLNQDPQFGAALSLALNFVLLGVAAFTSLGAQRNPFAFCRQLSSSRWVLAFLVMSGCSLAWTAAASLAAAVVYWCAMVADVAMVVLLLGDLQVSDEAYSLMKGYVYGACFISLIAWIMPAQSDMRLGDEELLGPNLFGYVCALGIFFGQCASRIRPQARVSPLALSFLAITLLRSLSKTSIIAFIVGESFLLMRDKAISRLTKAGMMLAATLALLIASSFLSSYFDSYAASGNQAETLTGRLGLWAIILDRALEQPWIGHGFHSVWKVIPPFGPDAFEARHAHNELLQQFYAYGVMGVCVFLALYLSFFRSVKRLPASSLKAVLLGMCLFVAVRGLTDTEPFDLSLPLWAIILCSALMWEAQSSATQRANG